MLTRSVSLLYVLLVSGSGMAGEPDTSARPLPLPTVADHVRAGHPQCLSKFATFDKNRHYMGGYVGGSCLLRGEGRATHGEGTYGYDYVPFGMKPGRIFLAWCHCREHQSSPGDYVSGGPPVFDIFTLKPLQRLAHRHREGHESHDDDH